MQQREYQIVVFGATGFTGKYVAEHLARTQGTRVRWAIAGRSLEKLRSLRSKLANEFNPGLSDLPCLIADSDDQTSLDSLCQKTHVVISTVGPFMQYGWKLVDSCVRMKCHYVDSTGETPFVREIAKRHHLEAQRNGVFVVPCCGFDCVPPDLGCYLLVDHFKSKGLSPDQVHMSMVNGSGGVSGGTVASLSNVVALPWKQLREIQDPYHLAIDAYPANLTIDRPLCFENSHLKCSEGKFVMSGINIPVVVRSASILNYAPMRYSEGVVAPNKALAYLISIFTDLAAALLMLGPIRWLVTRLVKPGTGPSHETLLKGSFEVQTLGTAGTKKALLRIKGRHDPGYIETGKMLAESGLCLALHPDKLGKHQHFPCVTGGVVTPSVAFGKLLAQRLRDADMVWDLKEID